LILRGVEILAVLAQLRPEGTHRRVLLDRVSLRHIDDGAQARPRRRPRLGLAVVAARRRDDAGAVGTGAAQPVDEGDGAARLEGADGPMVLVLDSGLGTGGLREKRPGVLRRGI